MTQVHVDVRADWRTGAACTDDPDRQFPGWDALKIAAAKAVCARCPVRAQCLREALDREETDGVWGGLTPVERVRYMEGPYTARVVPCPGCGRDRALTTEGLVRAHKSRHGHRCSGSGSKP